MEENYETENMGYQNNEEITDRRKFLGKALTAGGGLAFIVAGCDSFGDDGKGGLKEHAPPDTVKVPGECPPEEKQEICDYFAEVPEGFHERVSFVYFPDCRNITVRLYDAVTGSTLGTFANEQWDGVDSIVTNHTQDDCGRIRGPGGYNPNDDLPDNSIRGYVMNFGIFGNVGGREVDGILNLNFNFKGGKEYFVDPEGDGTAVSQFDRIELSVAQPRSWEEKPVVGVEAEYFGKTANTHGGGFATIQGPFTAPASELERQAIYKDRSGMRLEATIKENCRTEG